jgi:hypothetical protein
MERLIRQTQSLPLFRLIPLGFATNPCPIAIYSLCTARLFHNRPRQRAILALLTTKNGLSWRWVEVSCRVVKGKYGLPILLMGVFAVTRWPGLMPQNFSAAYALAFCAGVYFPGKLAWCLPLGTLFITDVLINWHYQTQLVNVYMLPNYAVYAALIWLGQWFTRRASWLALLGGGIWGALIFYFVTNTASWLLDPSYAKTLTGWIQALTTGVPGWPHTWEFFRNTLMSGGLFTGLFVGAMKLTEAPEEQEDTDPADLPEAEPSAPDSQEVKS